MRLKRLVVGPLLTAALALVALPGLAGSHTTTVLEPLPAGAFQPFPVPTADGASRAPVVEFDPDAVSDALVDAGDPFVEPGADLPGGPDARADVDQPDVAATEQQKPPRYTLTGQATFYDAGFTAMRLPRGTIVVICGAGGCIERVITDYGPVSPSRVVDLYRPDFFAICGCPSWSGLTEVTISVY